MPNDFEELSKGVDEALSKVAVVYQTACTIYNDPESPALLRTLAKTTAQRMQRAAEAIEDGVVLRAVTGENIGPDSFAGLLAGLGSSAEDDD